MNRTDRVKMVKSMEFICRQLNNEDLFYDSWATYGVADGDIEYGDLSIDNEDADFYIYDDLFSELMSEFLLAMQKAISDGGLYCDGVLSTIG